jgi:hypothetical protein
MKCLKLRYKQTAKTHLKPNNKANFRSVLGEFK